MWDNSKVTVELDELLKSGIDPWAFDYPSYYEGEAKRAFEQKVLDHYRFRQIGQETPARWLHYFRTRVREIMPYYIQLYKSEALLYAQENPFEAYNLTETYEELRTGSGTVKGETSETGTNDTSTDATTHTSQTTDRDTSGQLTRKHSDTPQGSIDNLDRYLTEATVESSTGTEDVTVTGDTTEVQTVKGTSSGSGTSKTETDEEGSTKYTMTRKGNIGVQPLGAEVNALRGAFLNIDLMIINELEDLFLGIF